MYETLSVSGIFLTITCGFLIVASFVFNFTLLVTLLKLRRLNRTDKSNYLLTHLILIDFISAFFILVPSAVGIFNDGRLSFGACRMQTWFYTFFFASTFFGSMVLSIERFIKYRFPLWHIKIFTKIHAAQILGDDNAEAENTDSSGVVQMLITLAIIGVVWLWSIFWSFIPYFKNYRNVSYYRIESQCDYDYEIFQWWLWIFFIICITVPFVISIVFFVLTIRIIYNTSVQLNKLKYAYAKLPKDNSDRNQTDLTKLSENQVKIELNFIN
jgi:hypothetical protein